MTDFALLSHRLDEAQPNWPGAPGLRRHEHLSLAAGDVVNTHVVELYTHYGTHCDLPYHFLVDGVTLDQVDHRSFIFHRPCLLDLPLTDEELVTAAHLTALDLDAEADILLLRSGFETHRTDHERYIHHGPGLAVSAAAWMRQSLPRLRAIALDWLSVCSLAHVDEGFDAHRTLLRSDANGDFVMIFEDVALSALPPGHSPHRVLAMPIFIDGLDGSPCTILAEVR